MGGWGLWRPFYTFSLTFFCDVRSTFLSMIVFLTFVFVDVFFVLWRVFYTRHNDIFCMYLCILGFIYLFKPTGQKRRHKCPFIRDDSDIGCLGKLPAVTLAVVTRGDNNREKTREIQ